MRTIALLACLAILLPSLAAAGTSSNPEATDPKGDGGSDALDLLAVWVDPADSQNLTLHATFSGAPPSAAGGAGTDTCLTTGTDTDPPCVFASLSYRFTFRVLDPSGAPTPAFPDYVSTSVEYRAGPETGAVAAPIGYVDARGTTTVDGNATAEVKGSELILRLPRASLFVNLPAGATPGAYAIDHLVATTFPELCFPTQNQAVVGPVSCVVPAKPEQADGDVPADTTTTWDRAPDVGYARVFTFPVPPPPAPTVNTTTSHAPAPAPITTPGPAPAPAPQPKPQPAPATTTPPAPAPATTTPPAVQGSTETTTAKKSPAPEAALALAAVVGLLAVRRRLTA